MMCGWRRYTAVVALMILALASLLPMLPGAHLVSAAAVVSPDGWGWLNPLPQGNTLRGIWGASAQDMFIVGDVGTILHYDGTHYSPMTSGTTDNLNCIWGTSSSVFAAGDEGAICSYGGSSWGAMSSGTSQSLSGVWGSSSSDVFAVGAGGTIRHYNGNSWGTMLSGTSIDLVSVWGTSASDVYVVGNSDVGVRSTILHYDGTSWSSMSVTSDPIEDLSGVWGSSASNVFAVGATGTILHYNGTSWSAATSGSANLNGVWGSSASDVFAVGASGTVRHYDGSTWSAMTSGTSADLYGAWGSTSSNVYAVGDAGAILHYDGSSWDAVTSSSTAYLSDVWGSSYDDVFAAGASGTILNYDGSTWSSMTSGTSNWLWGVWGSSSSDVFAVGVSGTVRHYDGSSWGPMTSGTSKQLNDVWGTASNNVYAVGDADTGVSSTILRYNGTSWSAVSVTSDPIKHLYGVWGSSSNDIFAVGEGGTILHYNGSTWSSMTSSTTEDLYGVWGSSGSDVFAVGDGGTIRHYGGSSWGSMTSGTSNDLTDVWGIDSDAVFAVGDVGDILYYAGGSWSSMDSGTTYKLWGVWGDTSILSVYAVGQNGTILHGPSPYITSVSPSHGYQGQTLSVIIAGENFDEVTTLSFGAGVTVNGSPGITATQITANITIAAGATVGDRDVTVSSPDDSDTAAGGFTVTLPPPAVTSVSPTSGIQGQTPSVTITGTNFTAATAVSFGSGTTVDSFTVNSATQITANMAISASAVLGTRDVSVTTPSGTGTLSGGFTVNQAAPTISTVSPSQGAQGQTIAVAILGTNLNGATMVSFGNGITVSFSESGPTQLTASIAVASDATVGSREVSVTTAGGTASKAGGFTITPPAPTITSISPDEGGQGQTSTIIVTGTNFTGATGVSFGTGVTVDSFTVDSATQITANVTIAADAMMGSGDVSVTTSVGTGTLAGGFTIKEPPSITAVDPGKGRQEGTVGVTITGVNLDGATAVSFGDGITVTFVVDDSTKITATLTIAKDAAKGKRDITVTTLHGTITLSEGFTVEGKGGGGCACGQISEPTPPSELLIGWGIIVSCAAMTYWMATRRLGRRGRTTVGSLQ